MRKAPAILCVLYEPVSYRLSPGTRIVAAAIHVAERARDIEGVHLTVAVAKL